MTTTIIKNGTIVTADLTYRGDVLIEGGRIIAIGEGLNGDKVLDATGCYVMPGGIDPHTHLEMPFMGTYSTDDFESGTRAALAGGTTMVVDFVLPAPGQGLLDGLQMWHNKSGRANCDYSYHMAITWWGEKVFDDMKTVVEENGINTFKHFMAYKGALMVNDDELYASFRRCAELGAIPLVHAENGDVVAELSARLLAEGNTGPEAHAYSRPPQVDTGIVGSDFGRSGADNDVEIPPVRTVPRARGIGHRLGPSGGLAGPQDMFAIVLGHRHLALKHIKDFILRLMPMAHGRGGAWRQHFLIGPILRQPGDVRQVQRCGTAALGVEWGLGTVDDHRGPVQSLPSL